MARWLACAWALGLGFASAASAEPCKPAGGLLFEIDQRAVPRAKLATAVTRLYANGAWETQIFEAGGKVERTDRGCLDAARLD